MLARFWCRRCRRCRRRRRCGPDMYKLVIIQYHSISLNTMQYHAISFNIIRSIIHFLWRYSCTHEIVVEGSILMSPKNAMIWSLDSNSLGIKESPDRSTPRRLAECPICEPWCWNMNPYIYPKNQPINAGFYIPAPWFASG